MPGLLRPDLQTGFVHAEATDLDRKLREGDGIVWPGDPRLFLSMGTLTADRAGYSAMLKRNVHRGEVVARRYEVYRNCEDGSTELIGHWKVEDFDRILVDLAPLRLDAPGRKDTLTQIDDHNTAVEKAHSEQMKGAMFEVLEHQTKLWHDRNNPKQVFRGLPGIPEKQPAPTSTEAPSVGDA